MNPLSPLTYYRRHKRRALLLTSLITLVTLGICIMVGLLNSFLDNTLATVDFLTRYSLVVSLSAQSVEPAVVSQIRTQPDVDQVIPTKVLEILVPSLSEVPLQMMGVSEADAQYLMQVCGLRLKEGRLPTARTNEIALSHEVASALGLRLGDKIGRSINRDYYANIPTELVLAGILEGDPSASGATRVAPGERQVGRSIRTGFASYEYLDGHELYASQPSGLIVVPKQGHKAAVDNFLQNTIRSKQTNVMTYGQLLALLGDLQQTLLLLLGFVDCVVAFVMALVVAAINQIALTQRLEEFGLLHAIGQDKSRLVRRVTLETTVLAGIGWIVGLALAGLILVWLKTSVYEPGGLEMNLASLTPLWFTLPTPLAVIALGVWSVGRVLARLDAIAVIERGQLGLEADQRRTALGSRMLNSPANPLSSLTFYLRHRRRGLMLLTIMALMVLGVALPVFVLSPISQAQKPIYEHLSRWSVVSSVGNFALDPGLVAQIKTLPAAAQAIPTIRTWLSLSVPPFSKTGMWVYSVPEDSLPYLVDLCQVHLKEGRLPRARTNEVAVSEAVAQNRGLSLGSKVGQPANIQDGFPTEMVVVGILSPSDQWLGFASYEYQQSNALYGSPAGALLVLPAEGRKAELDDWLEKNMVTARTEVLTFAAKFRQLQQSEQGSLVLFAAFESIIAIVAAIALAVLNYIFFSQRQDEFGILHAVGHSHGWLVLRAVKETASVIAVAWLIGAAVCLALMVFAQANVYAPAGVRMDLFNLGPWLFTLPIPLTVLAASTGTIARMLSKLDPVSIIERR